MFKYLSTAAVILSTSTAAYAVPVDLELSLLVDVSGSVDGGEFALQRDGYVNAFSNASLYDDAISKGTIGSIAVNLVYWSGSSQQVQSVGWAHIDSAASSLAFANAISTIARPYNGSTGIGSAIAFANPLFNGNGFEGTRNVMDVSGDGTNNSGVAPSTASAAFCGLGANYSINGITIAGGAGLTTYYEDNVQCGAGSFTLAATTFDTFGATINQKLRREITNNPVVPLPGAAWLLIAGLGGLGAMKRRKKSA